MTSEFAKEMARAKAKYPDAVWKAMHQSKMRHALQQEVDELSTAMWIEDLDSEHGILRESMHVIIVATRIREEMRRRANAQPTS